MSLEYAPLIAISLPILSSFLMPIAGRGRTKFRAYLSVLVISVAMLAILSLLPTILEGGLLHLTYVWAERLGLEFEIYADALAVYMSFLALFLCLLAAIYSVRYMAGKEGLTRYYSGLLIFSGSIIGVFLSGNLLQFFIFWELMTISCFLLVLHFQTGVAIRAAYKYFIMIHLGALCLLTAIIAIYLNISELSMPALGGLLVTANGGWLTAAMVLTFVGFGVKAAVVPLHTWLPDAHPEAPSSISALLSGIMVGTGIYGLIRFFYGIFGFPYAWQSTIITLGAITALVGVTCALVQVDIKRLIGFHTVSQLGLITMGIGAGTSLGLAGALFHLINHAFFKALLFLMAGAVIYEVGTRNMTRLGGLRKYMPVTFVCGLIAAVSISGIPPFNGFFSKGMITKSVFDVRYPMLSLVVIVVGIMTLLSFTKLLYLVFWRQKTPRVIKSRKKVPILMKAPMIALAACCIAFGLFAHWPLERIVLPALGGFNLGTAPVYAPSIFDPSLLTLLSYAGIVLAIVIWLKRRDIMAAVHRSGPLSALHHCVKREWWIDSTYLKFAGAVVSGFKGGRRVMSGHLRDYVAWLIAIFFMLLLLYAILL